MILPKKYGDPITLTMYYGSEKQAWIDDVVKDFNNRHITACDVVNWVKSARFLR